MGACDSVDVVPSEGSVTSGATDSVERARLVLFMAIGVLPGFTLVPPLSDLRLNKPSRNSRIESDKLIFDLLNLASVVEGDHPAVRSAQS